MVKSLPLETRIEEIRQEIDRFIDGLVEKQAKDTPGVPRGVLRNLIENRAPGCLCRQHAYLSKNAEATQ